MRLFGPSEALEERKSKLNKAEKRSGQGGFNESGKMSSQQSPAALQATIDREKVYTWIIELSNPETRQNALLELSKKREVVPDLAPMLWHSFGTVSSLLQEIINIYPAINPATLTAHQSNRVCNALALLQCFASHPETRSAFLQVSIASL
jgi:CCR4-NOT transcription complex subunit 9